MNAQKDGSEVRIDCQFEPEPKQVPNASKDRGKICKEGDSVRSLGVFFFFWFSFSNQYRTTERKQERRVFVNSRRHVSQGRKPGERRGEDEHGGLDGQALVDGNIHHLDLVCAASGS